MGAEVASARSFANGSHLSDDVTIWFDSMYLANSSGRGPPWLEGFDVVERARG